MPTHSEAVTVVAPAPEFSGANLGQAGIELRPDPLPTTDRLVLEEAAYQWDQIADITGNHHPTLAQFRGMVALASDRPAPVRDVHERPTPWDIALERFNREAPSQTEWDDFIANHPELWRLDSPEQQRETPPRLDIVIPDTAADKISYALRAMAHGAAIGARVVLHGDEDVRSHPKINSLLNFLGEDSTVQFADSAEDAALSLHLEASHRLEAEQQAIKNLIAQAGAELVTRGLDMQDQGDLQRLETKIGDTETAIAFLEERGKSAARLIGEPASRSRPASGLVALREQRQVLLDKAKAALKEEVSQLEARKDEVLLARDRRIETLLTSLSANDDVNSILALLPGSRGGEKYIRTAMTDRAKDADGINAENGVIPLTPQACIAALESFIGRELTNNLPIRMLVTGHGNLVGAPLLQLLAGRGFKINIPSDAKDVPHYPEPEWPGAAEVDVLPNAMHVINYEQYIGDKEYDVVFCCARGENVFDAQKFNVREGSIVIFIDAAGNVNLNTIGIDGRYAVAPPRGGVGPVTTMQLLGHAIVRKREHVMARRQEHAPLNRIARALGILGRQHTTARTRRASVAGGAPIKS